MAARDVADNLVLEADDIPLMAKLLREYNAKVRAMVDQLEDLRFRSRILKIVMAVAIWGIFTNLALSPREFVGSVLKGGSSMWISLVSLFGLASAIYIWESFRASRTVHLQELEIISSKLGYLVRTASQAEEHGVRDRMRRIELDLLLAESEAVLQHVGRLVDQTGTT